MTTKSKKIEINPWCPNCDWYKGIHVIKCPHCGFSEETGEIEKKTEKKVVSEEKTVKDVEIKKVSFPSLSWTWVVVLLLIGAGVAYSGLREPETSKINGEPIINELTFENPETTLAPSIIDSVQETDETPPSTTQPPPTTPPTEPPEPVRVK
jgi:hypothetical protein